MVCYTAKANWYIKCFSKVEFHESLSEGKMKDLIEYAQGLNFRNTDLTTQSLFSEKVLQLRIFTRKECHIFKFKVVWVQLASKQRWKNEKKNSPRVQTPENLSLDPSLRCSSTVDFGNRFDSAISFSNYSKTSLGHIITFRVRILTWTYF